MPEVDAKSAMGSSPEENHTSSALATSLVSSRTRCLKLRGSFGCNKDVIFGHLLGYQQPHGLHWHACSPT
jgi:hypothetical protein